MNLSKTRKKGSRAFTIPELLTIITVMAVLVIAVWVLFGRTGNAQARDAKRVSEVDTLRTALKLYHMDHGKYPEQEGTWCSIETDCTTLVQELLDGGYLTEVPEDPLFGREMEEANQLFSYQYMSTSSGEGYRIYIDLETREPYEVYAGPGSKLTYVYGVDGGGDPGGGGSGSFPEHLTGISGAIMKLSAADLDYDGDIDLIGGQGYGTDATEWYENDGNQVFTTHKLEGNQVCGVYTADVNQDGFIDILSADRHEELRWFENDGTGVFTTHLIPNSTGDSWTIYANDVDSDGDIDIVSGTYSGELWWFENTGGENFQKHVINSTGVHSVSAEDMDNDGDIDIVNADYWGNEVQWYENDGSEGFTMHHIADVQRAYRLYVKDIDSDGLKDIIVSEYHGWNTNNGTILWFENTGAGSFTEHAVESGLNGPQGVFAIDLDSDGDVDVLSTEYCSNYEIQWYENDGNEVFTTHIIQSGEGSPISMHCEDMDNDGDPDVIVGFYISKGIRWYENNF